MRWRVAFPGHLLVTVLVCCWSGRVTGREGYEETLYGTVSGVASRAEMGNLSFHHRKLSGTNHDGRAHMQTVTWCLFKKF